MRGEGAAQLGFREQLSLEGRAGVAGRQGARTPGGLGWGGGGPAVEGRQGNRRLSLEGWAWREDKTPGCC